MKITKLSFLAVFLLSVLPTVKLNAQVNLTPHAMHYNGSGSYPGIVRFQVQQGSGMFSQTKGQTFTSSGVFTFQYNPTLSNTSISILIYKYNTNSPAATTFTWSYDNWLNNSLQINVPYKTYLDMHNGQTWYFYIEKVSTVDFHYWIGN